jgi:HD superfamily phosphohydrolase
LDAQNRQTFSDVQSRCEYSRVLTAVDADKTLLRRVAKMQPSVGDAQDKAIGSRILSERPEIQEILHSHGKDDAYIKRLSDIVAGTQPDSLHQQILNSDYDCDRFDYVRRDSQAAGVDYGYLDFDFLVETFIIKNDPPTSTNRIIAIEESKGLAALEQYLLARHNRVCSEFS